MVSVYRRNIPLMYIYSVLIKRVSMPIIILYFLLNNLNFTQIGILASVMAIVSLILEIPGGIFADLSGRKTSLLVSSFFGFLTMFFYFIGNSFVYFMAASVAYGISGAFISGTRESLLYDTLKKMKMESQFKKYNGRSLFYSHLFNAFVLLMIPVIYVYDHKLPFLIGMLFFVASFIVALFIIEPNNTKNTKNKKIDKSILVYHRRLFSSFKEIFSNKLVVAFIVFGAITAGFIYMSAEFTQPLLTISGLQVIYFGIVYCLMRVVMGVSGFVTHRLEKYLKLEYLLFIGAGLVLISLIGYSYGSGILIILAVLVSVFAEGFNRIILDDELNKKIKSKNRTTILSISSLSDSLVKAVLVLIFGILADISGVQEMFIFAVIAFLVLVGFSLFYVKMNLR